MDGRAAEKLTRLAGGFEAPGPVREVRREGPRQG